MDDDEKGGFFRGVMFSVPPAAAFWICFAWAEIWTALIILISLSIITLATAVHFRREEIREREQDAILRRIDDNRRGTREYRS